MENQIWPVAVGCSNWLFARSLRAGHCAASIVSLIQSAKLNGHDPYAHLKDVLTKLPTQKNSQMAQLLPTAGNLLRHPLPLCQTSCRSPRDCG